MICFAESKSQLLELASYASKLSQGGPAQVIAILPAGTQAASEAEELFSYGATKVNVLETDCVTKAHADCLANHLSILAGPSQPLILLSSTKFGKEVGARLAQKLDAPLATECRALNLTEEGVVVERMVFSGNGISKERLLRLPAVVAIQPGAFTPERKNAVAGSVSSSKLECASKLITKEIKPKGTGSVKLENAERIVAIGRGLQKKEDLAIINELAGSIGAAVGCSRPVAADLGWLPDDRWIGLSGHKVSPKLYIAIGISGQVQHIAGMRDSKVVVAINKDSGAPIAQNSDYLVVGDLYAIVPALTKAIRTGGSGA